jgi:hypothetical protein
MMYEYTVVPAPKKGVKAKGVKTTEDRFAYALQDVMNAKGAEGWEYIRTDTLPSEERQGLTGRTTNYQNMMVFRRAVVPADEVSEAPRALIAAPVPDPATADEAEAATQEPTFSTRPEDRMMTVDTSPEQDEQLRAEPKLRAD